MVSLSLFRFESCLQYCLIKVEMAILNNKFFDKYSGFRSHLSMLFQLINVSCTSYSYYFLTAETKGKTPPIQTMKNLKQPIEQWFTINPTPTRTYVPPRLDLSFPEPPPVKVSFDLESVALKALINQIFFLGLVKGRKG